MSRPVSSERRRASWRAYRRRQHEAIATLLRAARPYCSRCGESALAALDLHHRDGAQKEFALSSAYARSIRAVQDELAKCVVLCANCHSAEHSSEAAVGSLGASRAVVEWRRRTKLRLVELHGGRCIRCGFAESVAALVFHHRDPATKSFAISVDGIPRAWDRLVEEASKCDLFCANCHRKAHAADHPN